MMKVVVVEFSNHPMQSNVQFIHESIGEALLSIEAELEPVTNDEEMNKIEIKISFIEMDESKFKQLPEFDGW